MIEITVEFQPGPLDLWNTLTLEPVLVAPLPRPYERSEALVAAEARRFLDGGTVADVLS